MCSITFILVVDMEDVLKITLEELKKNQLLLEYERHEEHILPFLKEAAQMEATLKTKMVHMIDKKTMRDVEREMSAIIGEERVNLIKKSFAIETYRMKVVKKPDGQSAVQVHRKGVEFQPEIMLMSIKDIETASVLQWVSLVIELFLFVLSCVSIKITLSEAKMKDLVPKIERIVRTLEFQKTVIDFLDAWNKAGDSVWGKARAVFSFLVDINKLNLFWTITKLMVADMSVLEKIRALAEVALTIVASFVTEGLALIVKIALAVNSAVHLAEKIANLNTFSEMKKTMN